MKDEDSSFCDVGAAVSCSKIRRSVFSEILNVPIAISGFLFNCVNLFGSIKLMRRVSSRRLGYYLTALFYWNVVGSLFVFYLIGAEIYLQTICPLCTVIHILQIIMLVLCYLLHFEFVKIPTLTETIKEMKKEIMVIVIINLIPLLIFNTVLTHSENEGFIETKASREFSNCLVSSGWKCFGRSGCSWCEKQRQLFENSLDIFEYVDCNSDNWKKYCSDLNISAFPTWIKLDDNNYENERWKGFASVETLASLSNCPIN